MEGTVSVAVATVWSDPSSPRKIDFNSLQSPVHIASWLSELTMDERNALCKEKRIQTQALFGERVIVEEQQEGWSKVVLPDQSSSKHELGYPGWIPSNQLVLNAVSDPGSVVRIVRPFAEMERENGSAVVTLSYNTELPYLGETAAHFRVHTPIGDYFIRKTSAAHLPSGTSIQFDGEWIVREAERFESLLYLWGGMSAYGYDCSGFSYNILKAAGYDIARDASDQVKGGSVIPNAEAKPGDLLFFAYEEGKGALHHVGIYYGDGKMIHSPTPGKKIEVTTIAGTFYEKEWIATRRYWKEEGELNDK